MASSILTVEAESKQSYRPSGSPTEEPRKSTPSLFRVIWRWHFYAGVIVAPLLMVVALTGAVYLFGTEIVDIANREQLFVDSVTEAAPYSALVASAEAAVPEGKATQLQVLADPWRTAVVTVEPPKSQEGEASGKRRNRGTTVYVNPYTASVQTVADGPKKLEEFFRVVLKIHRQLFIGNTGRIITELATTWTIILFLSGVYLWWPRRQEKVKGVWIPRWSAKRYTLLRDLHAMMGIYLLPICLTIVVTGLFYTLVWGESFHLVTNPLIAKAPATEAAAGEAKGTSADEENEQQEAYVPPRLGLDEAVAKARSLYPDRDVTVTFPIKTFDHYEVSTINDYARGTYGAMDSTGFQLHRDSGEVLELKDLWRDNERYWWHAWAYPLHVGSVLGMSSKLLWLAACLVLTAMPFTGLWMWWKRRPPGKTGFPRKQSLPRVPLWLGGTILLLGLLLPTFGLSVVAIIALEWVVRHSRRVAGAMAS